MTAVIVIVSVTLAALAVVAARECKAKRNEEGMLLGYSAAMGWAMVAVVRVLL